MKCHEPGCRRRIRPAGPVCKPGPARRPRPLRHVSWNVMRCHVRHARGAYSSARSGMTPSFRAAAPDIPSGSDICLSSAQVLSPGPVSLLPPACGGVPVSRVSRGCARGAAGGRIAAARLVRLIARARRRTHLSRLLTPGVFSTPSRSLSAEKPKGGPGSRLSLLSFYTIPPNVKSMREQKMKTSEIFHEVPVETRPGPTPCAPAFVPSCLSSSCPDLFRASMRPCGVAVKVDARNKSGHDGEGVRA